jgi:predicted nucleic acid-binding Zn ribbon protein
MNLDDQFSLEHLLFVERECRTCGQVKDLIDGFYLIRKNKKIFPSAYSYECKECTKKRVLKSKKKGSVLWVYPDW